MASNVILVGRRLVVWIAALAATLGFVGQCAIALHDARSFDALVWATIVFAVIAASVTIDKLKAFLEE